MDNFRESLNYLIAGLYLNDIEFLNKNKDFFNGKLFISINNGNDSDLQYF